MSGSHEIGDASCPTCGRGAEMATGLTSDDAPRPGDVTVCLYCVSVLEFGEGMTLKAPSQERKMRLLERSPELRDAVTALMRKRGMA